jgi:hypothetical protein
MGAGRGRGSLTVMRFPRQLGVARVQRNQPTPNVCSKFPISRRRVAVGWRELQGQTHEWPSQNRLFLTTHACAFLEIVGEAVR